MFSKILIANRGEIACRVIKTARRMGIRTVAVYSEADANARHVRLADEAVLLGPAGARESYLVADKIIDACKRTGAQAVHPGYGFLSENADFADALAANGIAFIGPPASAIRAMGSKSEAKKLMGKAAVPLTPGYHGDDQTPALLHKEADAIGYPVLIKAAAGGGGKGMRLVEKSDDFPDALASCKREAISSFGDDHVLIEKYITKPRHIEIQVFADSQGNCVYLFERDCSVQRRHQKVLEEAPAPGMTLERRRQMGEAAVAAAKAVGYVGAGTVEFIATSTYDKDGSFYFMEMNTRLQVEHPVTEMITGQDLVEWQLRVAAGQPLPLAQEQLQIRGHALEARIYAEDANKGFLPATGKLIRLVPPADSVNVRVDTGIEEGDEITPYYDPMIAKLIVWDETRDAALARMRKALTDYRVAGLTTNIDFLSRLVACPAFASADLDTGLIERQKEFLFPAIQAVPRDALLVATVGELLWEQHVARQAAQTSGDPYSPWHARDGWRMNSSSARSISFKDGDTLVDAHVRYLGEHWAITLGGETTLARGKKLEGDRFAVELDDRRLIASVVVSQDSTVDNRRSIFLQGSTYSLLRDDPLHRVDAGDSHGGGLTAPMPGKVVALLAQPGQKVEKGTPLLILEAMKMEHTITAPAAGTVKAFCYAAGEQVSDGAALVEFESTT